MPAKQIPSSIENTRKLLRTRTKLPPDLLKIAMSYKCVESEDFRKAQKGVWSLIEEKNRLASYIKPLAAHVKNGLALPSRGMYKDATSMRRWAYSMKKDIEKVSSLFPTKGADSLLCDPAQMSPRFRQIAVEDQKSCKNPDCPFGFGVPVGKGYCNSCYARYRDGRALSAPRDRRGGSRDTVKYFWDNLGCEDEELMDFMKRCEDRIYQWKDDLDIKGEKLPLLVIAQNNLAYVKGIKNVRKRYKALLLKNEDSVLHNCVDIRKLGLLSHGLTEKSILSYSIGSTHDAEIFETRRHFLVLKKNKRKRSRR